MSLNFYLKNSEPSYCQTSLKKLSLQEGDNNNLLKPSNNQLKIELSLEEARKKKRSKKKGLNSNSSLLSNKKNYPHSIQLLWLLGLILNFWPVFLRT